MKLLIIILQHGLESNSERLVIATLRAVANLCFDCDDNREAILNTSDGIQTIVDVIKAGNLKIDRVAFGALVNIAMENESVQTKLVQCGILDEVAKRLDFKNTDESDTKDYALKALSAISEADAGIEELLRSQLLFQISGGIEELAVTADLNYCLSMMDGICIFLETIMENTKIQVRLVESKVFEAAINFVEKRVSGNESDELADQLLQVKVVLLKLITTTTMSDVNMNLFVSNAPLVSLFTRFMFNKDLNLKLQDELRMTGALCLGNISRSDTTCLKLVKTYNIVPSLLELVREEGLRLTGIGKETKMIIKVIHAGLGALKNLSLAKDAREEMGRLNTIQTIVELFEIEDLQSLHMGMIGIIKNLCNGVYQNVYKVLTGLDCDSKPLKELPALNPSAMSPIGRVIRLVWNSSHDSDSGVRSEAGRLVVYIIKALHTDQGNPLVSNDQPTIFFQFSST